MAASPVAAEPNGPLSAAQQHEVADANDRARAIHRTARVAGFNGVSTAVLAACSAPFALGSVTGLLVTVGLALVAWNELRGRRRLLRFDATAPGLLGWNQLALLALIGAYCVWQALSGLVGGGPFVKEIAANPQLREVLGSGEDFDHMFRVVVVAFYGVVLALSVVFQGGNAWYYFSRRRMVDAYVRSTPAWVIDLQRLTSPS